MTFDWKPSACPLCGRGADVGGDWLARNSIGIGGGIDDRGNAHISLGVHKQCFEDAFADQELPRFKAMAVSKGE
jgi:hypothetical protein